MDLETSLGMDWKSTENHFFLNSTFPLEQKDSLCGMLTPFLSQFSAHCFILSSGTSSTASHDFKWVALSKAAVLASAEAVNQHLQSTHKDIWIHSLPDFHMGGLGIWARSTLSQARVVKLSTWNAKEFVQSIVAEQGTLTSLVPAQIYDLIQLQISCPPSLRAVLVGGGALASSVYFKALELGWPLLPTYGMTETASQIATAALDDYFGFQQRSLWKIPPTLKILPHLEVQETESGTIKVKGTSLLTAYIKNGAEGAVCVDPKEGGWLISQDRGKVNGSELSIQGRDAEFVKIGGEGVELKRLREILDETKLTDRIEFDVALIAVPDERLGHVVHLLSENRVALELAQGIADRFNSKVLPFERIRKVHQVSEIPRTALGKLIPAACLSLLSFD